MLDIVKPMFPLLAFCGGGRVAVLPYDISQLHVPDFLRKMRIVQLRETTLAQRNTNVCYRGAYPLPLRVDYPDSILFLYLIFR